MPDFLQQVFGQLRKIWGQLSGGQRVVIFAVVAGVLGMLGGLVWYGSQPDLVPLAGDLTENDLTAARTVLEEEGVAWSYQAGRILVPSASLGRLRMRLAEKGVVKLGRSADDWNQLSAMDSSKVQAAKLRARDERSLAAAIESYEMVEKAIVKLTVPKQKLVADERSKVKAAVVVHNRANRRLKRHQVQAISNLVSGSVAGLEPERVTISDRTGWVYATGSEGVGFADTMASQQGLQERKRRELQAMLDPVYGADNIRVGVCVDLTTVRTKTRITKPDKGIPIEEETETEETPVIDKSAQGWPGTKESATATNENTRRAPSSGKLPKKKRSKTHKKYMPGSTETERIDLGGQVERITASILVNDICIPEIATLQAGYAEKVAAAKDDAEKEKLQAELATKVEALRQPTSPAYKRLEAAIKAVAEKTLGCKKEEGRQDEVVVNITPFQKEKPVEYADPGMMTPENIRMGVQVLGALLVLFFLKGLIKKGKGKEQPAPVPAALGSAPAPEDDLPPDPLLERKRLRREIEKTVANDPGAVGRLLAGWLQEK